jgi:hypothetical protein
MVIPFFEPEQIRIPRGVLVFSCKLLYLSLSSTAVEITVPYSVVSICVSVTVCAIANGHCILPKNQHTYMVNNPPLDILR